MNNITKNKTNYKSFPPLLTELIVEYIDDCKRTGIIKIDVRAIFIVFGIAYSIDHIKKALVELVETKQISLRIGGLEDA